MRNFYKALTVAVLSGLVCYSGRSLNLQESSPVPTAEQSLLQAQKTTEAINKATQNHQQGDIKMLHKTQHNLNKAKETLHAAKDNIAENHQALGYYFQPKEPSPFRWEIRYEY